MVSFNVQDHPIKALIVIILFSRIMLLQQFSPYTTIDEGHVLQRVMLMLAEDTWDAGWYRYPTLLANGIALIASILEYLGFLTAFPIEEPISYNNIGPAAILFVGRIIVFSASLGIPVLVYLILRRLKVDAFPAFAAAFMTAFVPAIAGMSNFINTDTVAAFFVAATLYWIARYMDDQTRKGAFLAGCCAGLAVASKYPAGAISLSVGLAILLYSDLNVRKFMIDAGISFLGFVAAAFVAMPQLLLKTEAVALDIKAQAIPYATKVSPFGYIEISLFTQSLGFGALLLVFAVVGICAGVLDRRTRNFIIVCSPFLLLVSAVLFSSRYQPFRNLLPVLVPICVFGGIAFSQALNFASRHRRGILTKAALSVVLVSGFSLPTASSFSKTMAQSHSRIDAMVWISESVDQPVSIMVTKELWFSREHLIRYTDRVHFCPIQSSESCLSDSTPFDLLLLSNEVSLAAAEQLDALGYEKVHTFGSANLPSHRNFWVSQKVAVNIYALGEQQSDLEVSS